jgi:hypothetical protein
VEANKALEGFPRNVWITTGWGGAFHKNKNCSALWHGQTLVKKRGGDPSPVIALELRQAKAKDRQPCQACFPPKGKR